MSRIALFLSTMVLPVAAGLACGGKLAAYGVEDCKAPRGASSDEYWVPYQFEAGAAPVCMPSRYQRFMTCIKQLGIGNESYKVAGSGKTNVGVTTASSVTVGVAGEGATSRDYAVEFSSADPVVRAKGEALRACADAYRRDMGWVDGPAAAYEDFSVCMAQLQYLKLAPSAAKDEKKPEDKKEDSGADKKAGAVVNTNVLVAAGTPPQTAKSADAKPGDAKEPPKPEPGKDAVPLLEMGKLNELRDKLVSACVTQLVSRLNAQEQSNKAGKEKANATFRPTLE